MPESVYSQEVEMTHGQRAHASLWPGREGESAVSPYSAAS